MTRPADIAVVGGGIVGLATADAIRRARPGLSLTVLEKEPEVAAHQTGRNSGVIHAGLYYAPGSLKARLCTEGSARLFRYCAERGIATTRTGKIVVAMSRDQLSALDELERRGRANGVAMERIGPGGIAEREPRAGGIEALHVPATGAVDFGDVARALAADLSRAGHEVRTGFEVREARRTPNRTCLIGPPGDVQAGVVVNCAGLHVDRVMRLLGHDPRLRVLPFRGKYWSLSGAAADRVHGHIYPVPDPRLPHLGAHFTRNVAGRVELGPNAVWAWGREAYGRFSGRVPDALEALSYRGFRHRAS
ncbi:L-2-hydroxyglutarate oxidase [Candidatus Palauibacter sp.]|uniref:L-2-hydroxyglutarate oxidase n=1 Tax=Candidatus Palauibacter sp. TaxID=3101350 RepID=UPI003B02E70B